MNAGLKELSIRKRQYQHVQGSMKAFGGLRQGKVVSVVEAQEHWALEQPCLCGEWPNEKARNRSFISHFKELGVYPRAQSILLKTEPTK